MDLGPGLKPDDIAVESLKAVFQERFHPGPVRDEGQAGPALRLAVDPHAVEVGEATDKEKSTLAAQAYRLS